MNRTSLIICLAASMVATVGCASKNYVKQQTTPLINKTNELDDLAAQNQGRRRASPVRHSGRKR
jgi:hypothetical protein